MKRPYIICHMMEAIDGRIDCAEMEKLTGSPEYYETLEALAAPTAVSGRVTAEIEMAEAGKFAAKDAPLGREAFHKAAEAAGYTVVVDTKGTLLWPDQAGAAQPLLVLTSEAVAKDYLAYLEARHISWIACGKEHIDLARACEILAEGFGVARMSVVGGGTINAGFLAAGLLDEVSILLAPGIDGRRGMTASFDGLAPETEPFQLTLIDVKAYENGAVWLRYKVKH